MPCLSSYSQGSSVIYNESLDCNPYSWLLLNCMRQWLRWFLGLSEVRIAHSRTRVGLDRWAQIVIFTILICQLLFEHLQNIGWIGYDNRLHLTGVVSLLVHATSRPVALQLSVVQDLPWEAYSYALICPLTRDQSPMNDSSSKRFEAIYLN